MQRSRRPPGFLALTLALLAAAPVFAATETTPSPETPAQRDARMHWWRDARFGLFIHWGVYAVPAGIYDGKPIDGIGEWIMHNARIPTAVYRRYASQFNPVKYDPDAWVRLAKEAGMKYLVITSKHHDGFALFDSKATTWDVVDATPYGKDLLKPLAEACRRHKLKLGFYYSQAQDWNHPGGAAYSGHWDPAQDGSMDNYLDRVALPQVREILSNYGPIAVLWWDTPADMTRERAARFLPLLDLQPGIITNNRLGGDFPGDTETPEQFVPATGYPGRDWETCMTLNDTWGFKSTDHHWKPVDTLIRNLVDIASKGGNYLLNVGPTAEGLIPEPSIERLKAVGRWMQVNGSAIHDTSASPFRRLPWGRCTQRPTRRGATLFLHVFDWPADGRLLVPGLKSKAGKARLLATRKSVPARNTEDGVVVELPAAAPDAVCSVVTLEVHGPVEVEPQILKQAPDGTIHLPASEADCHGHVQYESGPQRDNLGFWTNPEDWVEWTFDVRQPGLFTVTAEIAAPGSGRFEVSVGDARVTATAPNTGDYSRFTTVELGRLELTRAGRLTLRVTPIRDGWQAMNLKSITLRGQI